MEASRNCDVTLCSACQGDPRASVGCRKCHGAGMGISSPIGLMVWDAAIDDFAFIFRAAKRTLTASLHLILFIASLTTLGLFIFYLTRLESLDILFEASFWLAGPPEVALFWAGILLDCFILFRLVEYGHDVQTLPGWGKPRSQVEEPSVTGLANGPASRRVDVSVYFTDAAWEVLDHGYHLARNLKRAETGLVQLFAAAIASSTGGAFLVRLGLSFEQFKEPFAKLVGSSAAGEGAPVLSRDARAALLRAACTAQLERRKHVTPAEVLLQVFLGSPAIQELMDGLGFPKEQVVHVAEWIRFQDRLQEDHERFVALAALKPAGVLNRSMTARATPLLDRFSEDLTRAARFGYLAPLVDREREMDELLRAIESGRQSVILVGEAGVGKTALIEGLARRMVEEDVPPPLFDRRLVSINVPQLVAAGDPALASERMFAVLEEVTLSGNIILVLQGIEALSGGAGQGPLDLAESFAAELERGGFIAIGTTTPRGYTQYIERRSLGSKLVRVDVTEMEVEAAIRVCLAKSASIEYKNGVFFSYAAVEKAVSLASRYLHDRALPEKALGVLREAAVLASHRRVKGERAMVTTEDVASVVHDKSNVPVEAVTQDESTKLLELESRLHGRVVGQEAAVVAVAQAMRRARAELREGKRPIANFLFLGPTGVGKTELAKTLADQYFGNEEAMVRIDMSEYQDAASVARMIGASGDERGGLLTEAVRHTPFTIVLLDEIEKAHPEILNLFLQVMDDGRLTDGVGRTVDFTSAVIIATSNAGTSFIQDEVKKGTDVERIRLMLLERELKGTFRPEFLNRFDAIIVFKPLTMEDVVQIAGLLLASVGKRLEEKGVHFRAEDAAVRALAEAGYDPLFGARPLRRVIQDRVDTLLADIILRKGASRRDTIVLRGDLTLAVEKAPELGT